MTDDDVDLLARAIWGESRGESKQGQEAVASVILNRRDAKRWPNTIRGVILQPKQFSAFNLRDRNRRPMLAVTERDAAFRQALEIARRAVAGTLVDQTRGANHYHEQSINPLWARGVRPTVHIGRHKFYRL